MVKLTKLKRIEKAKVKLKAKKLPKGQNVTDTSFKAKKIFLPGQLKTPDEQEIQTRKKLNVQELLSHLRHYNAPMRREGLSGLKELLSAHEDDIIKLHLPRVIDGVSSLVLDVEGDIRKSAFKLIEAILTVVSSEQIAPHFNVLQTYMSCAMTHINASVREDSLLLLDCLLNACPLLMVKEAEDILPNFLNMISNMKTNSQHGRTLSLHLNNKLISVQWRMKVFAVLTKFFSAIVSIKKGDVQHFEKMDTDDMMESSENNVIWNENSPLFVAEFISFKKEICNLPRVFSNTSVLTEKMVNTEDQEKTLRRHVMSLMPVLFEAWIEVAPERNSSEVNILSEEAAVMLQYVIETLQHVWECLQCWEQESHIFQLTSWFLTYYRKTVTRAFLPGFPFSLRENVFKPKGNSFNSLPIHQQEKSLLKNVKFHNPKCTGQNLSLVYLLISIHDGKNKSVVQPVVEFLLSCVMNWEDMESFPILEKILKELIIGQRGSWPRAEILQVVIRKCLDESAPKTFREEIFNLLCDFVLQPGCHKELRCEEFEQWISQLPYRFFQSEVSMKMVKVLASLTNQNHAAFMFNLKKRAKALANSLCEIPVTGNTEPFEGQKLILNVIFHVADSNTFNGMLKKIGDSEEYQELASYAKSLNAFHQFMNLL